MLENREKLYIKKGVKGIHMIYVQYLFTVFTLNKDIPSSGHEI